MITKSSELARALEVAITSTAKAAQICHCVKGTSDLVELYETSELGEFSQGDLVNAFMQPNPWFSFQVMNPGKKKKAIGKAGHSRLHGSLEFYLYAPLGQGNRKILELNDFISENFHATNIGPIHLRDVRPLAEYDVSGWKIQTLQVTFECNVA